MTDPGVEKLNSWVSPIQDDFIEQYLAEHEARKLSLRARFIQETCSAETDRL